MLHIKNIFESNINYNIINELSNVKLRKRDIDLIDAFYYRLAYSQINITKESIASHLNFINKTNYSYQGYDKKEHNIPLTFYRLILDQLASCYNTIIRNNFQNTLVTIAVDGTYNNNRNYEEMLNMGFYDVTNNIPIDIESFGRKGKNKEIKCTKSYIKKNRKKFRNTILIGDRAYFCYDFMKFLDDNGIYFIIRSRGDANNLDPNTRLSKSNRNYKIIMDLRSKTRHIVCKNIVEKVVHDTKGKKNIIKHTIRIEDNCHLITNLLDCDNYPPDQLAIIYKSRWDIEVFFKYLKHNFKFQHLREKDKQNNYEKLYMSELIITYIAKIIEKENEHKNKGTTIKINESHLVKGIFDKLLHKLLHNKLVTNEYNNFCKTYIKLINNKRNRSFPRTSKTAFSKWYVKGYSHNSQLVKMINAILNNTINKLNKNLKTKAKRIKEINGKIIDAG